jgi:hypothetical protein
MAYTRRSLITGALAGTAGLPYPSGALEDRIACVPGDANRLKQAIWHAYHSDKRVWGYVDRHSVDPGQTFNLMLSTGPNQRSVKGRIEINRIGYYPESDRALFWQSPTIELFQQPVHITAAALGAGWKPSIEQIRTDDWLSGYYAIDFIAEEDSKRDTHVAFIVVTNKDRSGDVLLELSSNTWQAYNPWGGFSLYGSQFVEGNAQIVSFDRPTEHGWGAEYYLVRWLERFASEQRFKLDYATNFDVYRDTVFTEKYRLFISGSHNEYWSLEEFKAVHKRIFQLGLNTMFMGANSAYWQIRYADVNAVGGDDFRGRQLICFKSQQDPVRYRGDPNFAHDVVTTRFRDNGLWPESMLTGVAFQGWFDPNAKPNITFPYFVTRNDLPFFEGTGYNLGDIIGDVVGHEWDNTDPMGDGKRLWDPKKSRIPMIDQQSIKVLFTGSPIDVNGRMGKSEAVYFVSPAGAKVFNAGTIRWALGLGAPSFEREQFKILNRNLLEYFLQSA